MIKFFNIRSGETREAHTEPMIAAFWGTSDRSPNAANGQDFGWRLAAETVVEVKKIQADQAALMKIATTYKLPLENVSESDVLRYISDHNSNKDTTGESKDDTDFEKQYQDEIRELEGNKVVEPELTEELSRAKLEATATLIDIENPSDKEKYPNKGVLIKTIRVRQEELKTQ